MKKKSSTLHTIFVIGDPHFRAKNFQEGEGLIEKCLEKVSKVKPSMIILLGDILDTHEVVRNTPWKQACRFIEGLSALALTYVLMGNHDLINQSQFLTDNHFFNPLKKWENVFIVDKPIITNLGNHKVCMCPYTPPGRFIEALDTLVDDSGEPTGEWMNVSCIFAHQEFAGVVYGGKESEKGDYWGTEYPPVISGHIHTPCQVGENVFYPGSSIQVASDEAPDKRVWIVSFVPEAEPGTVEALKITKVNLGLKFKKEIDLDYSDIKSFDLELTKRYFIKIKLRGTPEQFKLFRKSDMHTKLIRAGVKIGFVPIPDEKALKLTLDIGDTKEDLSFENILRVLVEKKPKCVQNAYKELYD